MPKGSNPNSRENLKKGKPFNAESARKAAQKSNQTKKYNASFRAAGKEMLSDEKLQKMWTAMIKRAEQGNIAAFKMLFDVMGEVEADSTDKNAEVNIAFLAPVSAPETPPDDIEDEVDEDE